MLETVAAVVGILAVLVPVMIWAWKRRPTWHPARDLRHAMRRAYRMHRLRRGKYVPNLSFAEMKAAAKNPGMQSLHPQVRAEIEQAGRAAAEALRGWDLDLPRIGPLR